MESPQQLYIPNVIDIEVTGRCEYSCPGCWGSKPEDNKRELTAKQWLKIFERIDEVNFMDFNSRVVISGGEPLLRKDLGKIVCGLCDSGKEVSLSTTGLDRYNILDSLLDKLSSIGIPIDGHTPELNSPWRKHNKFCDGGLEITLNTLNLIEKTSPDLRTSVRTLVHHGNVNSISNIPDMLEKSGINISRLRWIIYELNARKTKIKGYENTLTSTGVIDSYKSGSEQFEKDMVEYGAGFKEVIVRKIGNMAYRNFIINPYGECRAVVASTSKNELIERQFGNIYSDFKDTIDFLNYDIETIGAFSRTAADSPEYFYFMQDKGIDI
jgi:MoaA/NifB/PqqE/SkfB family radical SAM enzyme